MPRNDIILWIDLECTGSSNDAHILEFGGVITDASPELIEVSRFTTSVLPFGYDYDYSKIEESYEDNVVVEMHKKSGLTEQLQKSTIPDTSLAEKSILRWINDTVGFSTEHIPWGGSGVGHYDNKYIKRDWPYLSKRLTYWVYDVGVMRRMLRLVGIELSADTTEIKTHRALDDILLHVEEARQYLKLLKNLKDTTETI